MKVYKIRTNDKNYPYLKGGCRESKRGKIWHSLGFLKRALKNWLCNREFYVKYYNSPLLAIIPDDWIIEEYELIKTNEFSAKNYMEKEEEKNKGENK